jgi:hypothetical protein
MRSGRQDLPPATSARYPALVAERGDQAPQYRMRYFAVIVALLTQWGYSML